MAWPENVAPTGSRALCRLPAPAPAFEQDPQEISRSQSSLEKCFSRTVTVQSRLCHGFCSLKCIMSHVGHCLLNTGVYRARLSTTRPGLTSPLPLTTALCRAGLPRAPSFCCKHHLAERSTKFQAPRASTFAPRGKKQPPTQQFQVNPVRPGPAPQT